MSTTLYTADTTALTVEEQIAEATGLSGIVVNWFTLQVLAEGQLIGSIEDSGSDQTALFTPAEEACS